jgi:hypothetical protein
MSSYHAHRPKTEGGTDPIFETPWARRRRRSSQSIGTGGLVNLTYTDDTNDFPTEFEIATIGGNQSIRVLKGGMYSILCRVAWESPNDFEFVIDLNIYPDGNPDIYSYPFSTIEIANNYRSAGTGAMDIRMEVNQWVTVFLVHEAGASRNVADGTYLEVRRLPVSPTMTGLDWP